MTYKLIKIDINGIDLDAVIEFDYTPAAHGDEAEYSLNQLLINIDNGVSSVNADCLLLDTQVEETLIDKLENLRLGDAKKEA